MAARPIDAAEGYRIYRAYGGAIELDEINEALRGMGLRPVSPRMYLHYRRMAQHGYETYVPINRFDIAVASDHAWSEDLRARYPEIRQPVAAEIIWMGESDPANVEGLGTSTATVRADAKIPADANVVLRLSATGIERVGRVVRADPRIGLYHIAFDPYTSVPLASADEAERARLIFRLPDESHSVVALSDLLLKLERLLFLASRRESPSLVRVSHLTLENPIDIQLVGALYGGVFAVTKLLEKLAQIRKTWHEGGKVKAEKQGIELDNMLKRRQLELDTASTLAKAVDDEFDADETPLLDGLQSEDLPKGDKGSSERRRLIDTVQAALELPPDIDVEAEREVS
ncbi:MAG TPA: hypothetical protein VF377_12905 [Acidimicrobiia bacterium]|jgi:hypothetical protein